MAFSLNHNQITSTEGDEKLVSFRYQTVNKQWRRALHACNEYEEVLESSQFLPIYVRISEKRWPQPTYLILIPSRRFPDIKTYVGFHGLELLNAYLQAERIDLSFDSLTHDASPSVVPRIGKIERFLPSEVFQQLGSDKWSYTLFAKQVANTIYQKTVKDFRTKSAAISALRKEVSILKESHELAHGWRDACPEDMPHYEPKPRPQKEPRNRSKFNPTAHPPKFLP